MTKETTLFPILPILFFFFISGCTLRVVKGQELQTWCVANPMSTSSALMTNLDYACSHVSCHAIQQGGSCFYPNTRMHHTSFAMNLYYQSLGRHKNDCDFGDSGLISLTDPSHGSCTFESEGGLVGDEETLPATWCVAKPGTSDELLQENIDFSCNHVDCTATHDGGPCYSPTTLINHASYTMNLYYQGTARKNSSCDFKKTGLLVTNDPSFGNCTYESRYC